MCDVCVCVCVSICYSIFILFTHTFDIRKNMSRVHVCLTEMIKGGDTRGWVETTDID